MALSASTLATELKKIGSPTNDTELKAAWAGAWSTYWEESTATSLVTVNANPAPTLALTAFKDQIVKLNNFSNTAITAAGIILNACKDFWTVATPLLAYTTAFPPVAGPYPVSPPFMLNPLAETTWIANLVTVFGNNKDGGLSVDDSMTAIATAIHSGQAGATFLDTTLPASGGPLTYIVA